MVACEPAETPTDSVSADASLQTDEIEISSTGVLAPVEGTGTGDVAFLPNAVTPWASLIASAPREGGLDLYNVDGQLVSRLTGPRLHGLATAPDFQLRGQSLPLIFGADRQAGRIRAYAVALNGPDLLEAPIDLIEPEGGISSVCHLGSGIGYNDILVLSSGALAEIWRISDTGEDLISAERQGVIQLEAPARLCSVLGDAIFISGPSLGLSRLSLDGRPQADSQIVAAGLSSGTFLGREVVLVSDGASATLQAYDAETLVKLTDITIRNGLSIPGVERPGALAISDASFGGASYQSGLVAITDESDGRVRLIAHETFARHIALLGEN